jgi:hypothetical protein
LQVENEDVSETNPIFISNASFVSSTPTTRPNNTTAYTIGDVVGTDPATNLIFSNVGNAGKNIFITGLTMRVNVANVPSGMSNFRLHLYNAAPTAIADNLAYNLPSEDREKYLGYIDMLTPQDFGDTLWTEELQINKMVKLVDSNLYGILETKGAFTPTAQCVKTLTLHTVEV